MDLYGCSISEDQKYRKTVFGLFPSLKILDNKDREGVEVDYDDDDEGNEEGGEEDDEDDDEEAVI